MKPFLFIAFVVCSFLFSPQALAISVPKDSTKQVKRAVNHIPIKRSALEKHLDRKLSVSERFVLFLYNKKLIGKRWYNRVDDPNDEVKATSKAKKARNYAIMGWAAVVLGLIPGVGFIFGLSALILHVLSLIYGIQSLSLKKKDNGPAVTAVVLSGLYFFFLILGILLVVALAL